MEQAAKGVCPSAALTSTVPFAWKGPIMAKTHSKPIVHNFKDIEGQRFGRLRVKRFVYVRQRRAYWLCVCECGTEIVIRGNSLCTGNTKTCGCRRREGYPRHGKRGSKAYKVWADMIQRCENPNNSAYKNYGSRGITVCKEWHDFVVFYADMGDPPTDLTLERIDNDENYEPSNCCWATRFEQRRNSRQNRLLTFQGKTQCFAAWVEELKISRATVYSRLRRGWNFRRALITPARKGNYCRRKSTLYITKKL